MATMIDSLNNKRGTVLGTGVFSSWIQGQLDLQEQRKRYEQRDREEMERKLRELELRNVHLIHANPPHITLIPPNV